MNALSVGDRRRWLWGALLLALLLVGIFLQRSLAAPAISYRIARDRTWFPANLVGKEQNMVGFTNDLFDYIAKEQSIDLQLIAASSRGLYSNLEAGAYNAVLALPPGLVDVTRRYLLSDSFYKLGPVLVIPKGSSLRSLEAMGSKVVGIMSDIDPVFNGNHYPTVYLRVFTAPLPALEQLAAGQIDGLVLPALIAHTRVMSLFSDRLEIATAPLTDEGLRVIAMKSTSSAELIEAVNKTITKMRANGVYDQLLEKWGLINTERL